jgi:creatinine amidohydrolase
MSRPYILAESNWREVRDAEYDLVVLPWGATEAHNFHLPYGTDNFEADAIAGQSAAIARSEGAKVLVLPTIPFGVNTGQRDIRLDININPSTQLAIVADILDGLYHQGFRKFMILNSHGGNDFKFILRELGVKYPDMFMCTVNWYQIPGAEKIFAETGDHAGEMETSLMLHLEPELVSDKKFWGEGREKKNKLQAFREKWAWTERNWPLITDDTGVGNPAEATAEKGKIYFEHITAKVAQVMIEICRTDVSDFYEE